jgi:hypothetical protein|tara:strand:+ start:1264 stop:1509 length:246 start_codon:yes stop_codon:yes gene_type:complete
MQQQQQQGPPIDLSNTSEVKTEAGGVIFKQGFVLRTVSKFITGTDEDALLPIPVFYDPETNKILNSSVPKDLREEYKDQII